MYVDPMRSNIDMQGDTDSSQVSSGAFRTPEAVVAGKGPGSSGEGEEGT